MKHKGKDSCPSHSGIEWKRQGSHCGLIVSWACFKFQKIIDQHNLLGSFTKHFLRYAVINEIRRILDWEGSDTLVSFPSKPKPETVNASMLRNQNLRTTNHKQPFGLFQGKCLSYSQASNLLALLFLFLYKSLPYLLSVKCSLHPVWPCLIGINFCSINFKTI